MADEHVRPATPIHGGTTLIFPDGREFPADAVPKLLMALEYISESKGAWSGYARSALAEAENMNQPHD